MARTRLRMFLLRRSVLFRIFAIFLGFLLFALFELLLRWSDVGKYQDVADPLVGFSEVRPLFVLNDDESRYTIPESRQAYFVEESFAASKADNEFRIFCLGGSTVQGRPYSIETSFTTWLELSLQAADSSKQWQVVNCGGVSYASYRLVPILKEALKYRPDLFIIYTGHNEFLEDRTYGHIKNAPNWYRGLQEQLLQLRTFMVAQSISQNLFERPSDNDPKPLMPVDVDALLDYRGGLEHYHRDDEWQQGVVSHFEINLRRMIRIARTADVPTILFQPVSNLKDTPPFKCESSPDLTSTERTRFDQLWEKAKQESWKRLDQKIAWIQQALKIDPRHANARFLLAKCFEEQGNISAAHVEYQQAKDNDICPLRMLESMHDAVTMVAQQTGTPLLDARHLFESFAEHGIPGDVELVDHVHPTIDGHQRIGGLIFDHLVAKGTVHPSKNWAAKRDRAFKAHLADLPDNYFPESIARLDGLRRWAQGRAELIRSDAPK